MTDQPATTPAADRVTTLTLRIGDLREQRDQARARVAELEAELETARDMCARPRGVCLKAAVDLRAEDMR